MEHELKTNRKKKKKRLSAIAVIAIVLGGLILLAAAAVSILGLNLLSGISRPQTPTQFEEDPPEAEPSEAEPSAAEPEATPDPGAEAAPSPSPTAMPDTALPLEDVCTQTHLDAVQLEKLFSNANESIFRYTNILLIGVDRRGSSGKSNADVMMIATIDRVHNSIKLTTLMRDMLVNIPGAGYGKLNSAAAQGGVELLMDTINENFHLNISEYVLVDFKMFVKIIDEIGGVTVRMSAEEISAANDCIAGLNKQWGVDYLWDGFIFAEEGNVRLNGKQALGYVRIRHTDSDFSRTKRQFKVLNAAFAKFLRLELDRQYSLLSELMPLVETDMNNALIISCAAAVLDTGAGGMLYYQIPQPEHYESGKYERKSVILADIPMNAWLLHQFIFESAEVAEEARVLSPGASTAPRTPTPTYPATATDPSQVGIVHATDAPPVTPVVPAPGPVTPTDPEEADGQQP